MLVGASMRRHAAVVALGATITATAIVATPFTTSAAGFACGSGGSTYEVRSGDSWYGIADRVDVAVGSLLDINDASADDLLVAGDRLCLPNNADVTGGCTSTYRVESGDSWNSIGRRAGVSGATVAGANGAALTRTIHPGQEICLPAGASTGSSSGASTESSAASSGATYTVASGDSWSAIAWRADVTMRALLDVNSAGSGDFLLPGDVLRLPAGAKQPTGADRIVLKAAPTQGPCGFLDTWGDARSRTRRHTGVDVFSGFGNYVYAVVDGRLTGRVWDQAGRNSGNAWTLTGSDGTRFFYAHLSGFAPEVAVGSSVKAGQIIGWVGSTGNASAPHLHLEIRPGGGSPVNPYPILRAQGGCNGGRPYTQPGGWVPNTLR